ncbi:predicted protein [Arabidopsis lyrata subsp. lyrata]|uniref:Predicted protein n=1 Tax=Arabidopsis lyrata subsp. lyrata TaxID=81972 RepID=D7LPN9_ARALL|nr:predicted protein [Arabidopsis lyrata subsp. lyrata]
MVSVFCGLAISSFSAPAFLEFAFVLPGSISCRSSVRCGPSGLVFIRYRWNRPPSVGIFLPFGGIRGRLSSVFGMVVGVVLWFDSEFFCLTCPYFSFGLFAFACFDLLCFYFYLKCFPVLRT